MYKYSATLLSSELLRILCFSETGIHCIITSLLHSLVTVTAAASVNILSIITVMYIMNYKTQLTHLLNIINVRDVIMCKQISCCITFS
jgi:hypothetical protein